MNTQRLRRAAKVSATTAVCGVLLTGGLVACGKVATKQQVGSAKDNLMNAKTASFTMHFDDPNNEFKASAKSASDKKAAAAVKDSSLTFTLDPEGNQTIGSVSSASPSPAKQDLAAALKKSGAFDMTYAYKGKDVFSLRSVEGVLYVRLSPTGYKSVAGKPLPLDQLGDTSQVPGAQPAVDGIKAGKWLSLDLASVYTKAKSAGLFTEPGKSEASANSIDPAIGHKLIDAVQSHTTHSTTKNGKTIVVSVKVDAKAALSAVVDVLSDPQFKDVLGAGTDLSAVLPSTKADIAKLPAGTVNGSITANDDHVTKMDVDLGSIAALSKDPEAKKIKTAKLVVDVNDHAKAVTNPSSDQVVQVDSLADALFKYAEQSGALSGAGAGTRKLPRAS